MLRKSLLALISGVALCGANQMAFAGDMPVKARAPGGYDWSGFYIGATAGSAWTKADVGLNTVNGATPLYLVGDIAPLNAFGSPSLSGANAVFGGKFGFNHQWGSYVAGLEADFSAFRFNKTAKPSGNPFTAPGFSASFNTNVSTNWLATLRAKAGYAVGHALFYGTGGLSFSRISFSDTFAAFSPNGNGTDNESVSASKTKLGWAAGVGVDYALSANWIVSAEYLHVDLGSVDVPGSVISQLGPKTATFNFSTRLTSDIVRAGIAYKF